jgi:hypothetical protein
MSWRCLGFYAQVNQAIYVNAKEKTHRSNESCISQKRIFEINFFVSNIIKDVLQDLVSN